MPTRGLALVTFAMALTVRLTAGVVIDDFATFYPGGSTNAINACHNVGAPCSGSALAPGTNWTVTYLSQASAVSIALFGAEATVTLTGDNSLGSFPSSFESAARVGEQDTVTMGGGSGTGTLDFLYQVSGPASATGGAIAAAEFAYVPIVSGVLQYSNQTFFGVGPSGLADVIIPFTFGTPQAFDIDFYALADILSWTTGSSASANYFDPVVLQSLVVRDSSGAIIPHAPISSTSGFAYQSFEAPEPGTLVLCAFALVLVAALRRHKLFTR